MNVNIYLYICYKHNVLLKLETADTLNNVWMDGDDNHFHSIATDIVLALTYHTEVNVHCTV